MFLAKTTVIGGNGSGTSQYGGGGHGTVPIFEHPHRVSKSAFTAVTPFCNPIYAPRSNSISLSPARQGLGVPPAVARRGALKLHRPAWHAPC